MMVPAQQRESALRKRACVYARYSSRLQSPTSIEDQVADATRYIEKCGFELAGVYSDSSLHAEAIQHRPGLVRLLEDLERKKFDVLVIEQVDRLSRSLGDAASIYELLIFLGVELHTPTGGVVTSIEVAFKGWQAAEHNKDHAVKVRRGLEGTIRRGKHFGKVPYGYKLVYTNTEPPERIRVVDEPAAAIVRHIYEEYASGMGSTEICWRLNAEGVPGPRGPWNPGGLLGDVKYGTGILRNPLYVGKVRFGVTKQRKDPRTGRRVCEAHDPNTVIWKDESSLRIVDQGLYEHVQERLKAQNLKRLDKRRAPRYLFSGKIFCAHCGGGYVNTSTGSSKRGVLVCSSRIYKRTCDNRRRVDRIVVEDAVLDGIRDTLLQPELVEKFADAYLAEARLWKGRMDADQSALNASLKETEVAIRNLVERLKQATPTVADLLMNELNALGTRKTDLESRIAVAAHTVPEIPDIGALAERLRKQVVDLRNQLGAPGPDGERARSALRALVDRIEITPLPSPAGCKRGARAARVAVSGKVVELLGLANSGSERVIVIHEGTLMEHYNTSVLFSFSVEIGVDQSLGAFASFDEAPSTIKLSSAGPPSLGI